MKNRKFTILILAVLILSLLTGCGNSRKSYLTPEEAQKIALKHAGLSSRDVDDIHTHVISEGDVPGYSIHITIDGTEYEYVIAANNGEILHADEIP